MKRFTFLVVLLTLSAILAAACGEEVTETPTGATPGVGRTPSPVGTTPAARTPTGTPGAAVSPTGTPAVARTPTGTPAAASPTGTPAAARTPTGTPMAVASPTGTPAAARTPTPTGTPRAVATPTGTPAARTPTPTGTPRAAASPTGTPVAGAPGGRTGTAAAQFNVLAGSGQDTTAINAFFPSTIRISVGDTITWTLNSDEVHTATFLGGEEPPPLVAPVPGRAGQSMLPQEFVFPSVGGAQPPGAAVSPTPTRTGTPAATPTGTPRAATPTATVTVTPTGTPGAQTGAQAYDGTGLAHSGVLANGEILGFPENTRFSLTFNRPGTYEYYCLIHPFMTGTVIVEEQATGLPNPEEVNREALEELSELQALAAGLEQAATSASAIEVEQAGPDTWLAQSGIGFPNVEVYDFVPRNLTIEVGDTVVWTSTSFHTVTFDTDDEPEDFITLEEQGGGQRPLFIYNPDVMTPSKPSPTFEAGEFFNSGWIGPAAVAAGLPGGAAFSLTFDEPGTFDYYCAVHRELGMVGTITVVPETFGPAQPVTPTGTPGVTATPSPTGTPRATPSPTGTATPRPTVSPTPTGTPRP